METRTGRLVVRAVLCAVLGVVVAAVGTVAHRTVLLGVELPGGIAAGLLLCLLLLLAAATTSRAWAGLGGLLGFGLGWVTVVQVLSLRGPGGDVLVPAEAVGYAWTYGGLLVVAAVTFLPRSWFSDRPVRARGAVGGTR